MPEQQQQNTENKIDYSTIEVPRMVGEKATEEIADIATWILLGAEATECYLFNSDLVLVKLGDKTSTLHIDDFKLAKTAADVAFNEYVTQKNYRHLVSSPAYMLECRKFIRNRLIDYYDRETKGKVKVLMIPGDNAGCGYWRMRLPAGELRRKKGRIIVHVSDIPLTYEECLGYDVIIVQRFTDFNQFYTLRMLHDVGKKIIYEIDDDLFNVERHNPSHFYYSRSDTQLCARQSMDLADKVMLTTKELADSLDVVPEKRLVYPNSIDLNEYPSHLKTGRNSVRLFWAGSNTHNEDFKECLPALVRIMKEFKETELLIFGTLPQCLVDVLKTDNRLMNRVSQAPPVHTEAYFHMLKHKVDVDIGLIPLNDTVFNRGKSVCKCVEYTLADIAVVASDCAPYNVAFTHNKNALLCKGEDDWYKSIKSLVCEPLTRRILVDEARKLVREKFDLKKNVEVLESEICGLVV